MAEPVRLIHDNSDTQLELPKNVEAEAALLGAIMIDNRIAEDVQLKLRAEHFFEPVHGRIYDAIMKLIDRSMVANPVTLKLSRQGQSDTLVRFAITSNSEFFTISNYGTLVGTIGIDPSNWLINGNAGVSFDPTLSVKEEGIDQKVALLPYPNPSSDFIQILQQQEQLSYELYAANGKLLQAGSLAPGQKIDVRTFKKGSYILLLMNANQMKTTKLVTIN